MFRTTRMYILMLINLLKFNPTLREIKKNQRNGVDCKEQIHQIAVSWAQNFIPSTGSTVTVIGEENLPQGPVCFISNHQSFFDIPLLLGYINKPKAFVSKIEIKKVPLLSDWMTEMKCVFMNRKDMRQSVKAIQEGSQNMKNGQSMVIFPEGTRSENGEVREFKAGSFKMAINAGVPIVPVTIDGARNIFEANGKRIKAANVRIIIHKPVDTVGLSKEEILALHKNVRDQIASQII